MAKRRRKIVRAGGQAWERRRTVDRPTERGGRVRAAGFRPVPETGGPGFLLRGGFVPPGVEPRPITARPVTAGPPVGRPGAAPATGDVAPLAAARPPEITFGGVPAGEVERLAAERRQWEAGVAERGRAFREKSLRERGPVQFRRERERAAVREARVTERAERQAAEREGELQKERIKGAFRLQGVALAQEGESARADLDRAARTGDIQAEIAGKERLSLIEGRQKAEQREREGFVPGTPEAQQRLSDDIARDVEAGKLKTQSDYGLAYTGDVVAIMTSPQYAGDEIRQNQAIADISRVYMRTMRDQGLLPAEGGAAAPQQPGAIAAGPAAAGIAPRVAPAAAPVAAARAAAPPGAAPAGPEPAGAGGGEVMSPQDYEAFSAALRDPNLPEGQKLALRLRVRDYEAREKAKLAGPAARFGGRS